MIWLAYELLWRVKNYNRCPAFYDMKRDYRCIPFRLFGKRYLNLDSSNSSVFKRVCSRSFVIAKVNEDKIKELEDLWLRYNRSTVEERRQINREWICCGRCFCQDGFEEILRMKPTVETYVPGTLNNVPSNINAIGFPNSSGGASYTSKHNIYRPDLWNSNHV